MFKAFLFLAFCVSAVVLHFYSCTWGIGFRATKPTVITLPGPGSQSVYLCASGRLRASEGWSGKQKTVVYGLLLPIALLIGAVFIYVSDAAKKNGANKNNQSKDASGSQGKYIERRTNGFTVSGFVLGLASIFLSFIGMIPILAIVFSAIGLGKYDPVVNKNRWMAVVGLILGILYFFVYAGLYGHI